VQIPIAFYVLCSPWEEYDEVKLSKELVRVLRHGMYKKIKIDSGNYFLNIFISQTFCKVTSKFTTIREACYGMTN